MHFRQIKNPINIQYSIYNFNTEVVFQFEDVGIIVDFSFRLLETALELPVTKIVGTESERKYLLALSVMKQSSVKCCEQTLRSLV